MAGSWLASRAAAVPGNTPVRSSVPAEVPDSVYGTPSPLPLRRAQRAQNDRNNDPRS